MRYQIWLLLLAVLFFFACQNQAKTIKKEAVKNPNILLIMADDLGYGDLGCYGGEIATPNIDQLAKEGLRLTECYNNGICAPSRASLLTGQYPHQAGIGFFNMDLKEKGYEGYLNETSLTFGEVFQQANYQTYVSGKWHVGNDSLHWAKQRGFDRFFGFLDGGSSYFDDEPIMKVTRDASFFEDNERFQLPDNFYATDFITDKGIQFLDEGATDKPFLLYMAYNAPHWPLHAKEVDIKKYEGTYDLGWDALKELRFQRQIELGVASPNQPQVADTSFPKWVSLSEEEQKKWARKMEIYAAMVDNLDQNIGRLIDYLKVKNQLDNTLVIFVSDNGADDWDIQKIPIFFPSKREIGQQGSNESYGRPWAAMSNVPFKKYKSKPYEGGISSPFIARFPGLISANKIAKGSIHFIDFLPTMLAFAKIDYPKSYKGIQPQALVGENFLPLLKGEDWQRKNPIFCEWGGHRAVRKGNWKLVSTYPTNQWELYDLNTDRSETNNQAEQEVDVVKALDAAYQQWAIQTGVVPWSDEMQKRIGFKPPKD